jgi:hypothetical protein
VTDRNLVVVVFGAGPNPGWCDLSHCPMYAHGPFTRQEADEAVERLPAWTQPHILDLRRTP